MNTVEEIKAVVRKYQESIHTQKESDFREIWAQSVPCNLISIGTLYTGLDCIYRDFLIGGIQRAYEKIDLIADSIEVNVVREDMAVVIFAYHTECIRRETQEPYGICGLETQVMIRENGSWKLVHVHYSKQ